MKYRTYQVTVKSAEEGHDEDVFLEVVVEVPAEFGTRDDERDSTSPIPLQQQIRTALEAARPGNP